MSELSALEASFEAQSTEALIALALPMPIDDVYDDDGNVTYVTQRWPIYYDFAAARYPWGVRAVPLFILP